MEEHNSGTAARRAGRGGGEEPAIEIAGLTKSFGPKEVLRGIDLTVEWGEILGYIGPNGAGKTTTVKILMGMLDGFLGRVRVCGYDVAVQPLEVKARVGYVPEAGALYEALTPMEFLRFVGSLHGLEEGVITARAEAMLGLLGLNAEKDRRISTFSRGMRQKVLITAALIHNPSVVLMDEPLSGLDANTALVVKEILAGLAARGRTVFYSSHVMDVVERICHRIAVIAEGRIVAHGSFEELKAMSKAPSLEQLFTRLTGRQDHADTARRFIDAMEGAEPVHG